MSHSRTAAFTLLELLIALAVLGITLSIATSALLRWRDRVNAENFISGFAFDLNRYRSLTHATGTVYSVAFTNSHTYSVQTVPAGPRPVLTRTENNVTVDLSGAVQFTFDSRGYARAQAAGGADSSNTTLPMTLSRTGQTQRVLVTALGTAKVLP